MRNVIIGTAGHIDHGKTSLVKALTGIDTDRLQEEQERGLTIDIGFAFLDIGDGRRAGIVDVPGHERFIKNMLAGATGIDLALFIVAADDSVMPQTKEHLEILDLLGIKRGIIALTKKDLVDDEWLELVIEDIENLVEGTVLEGADIVPLSSTTGEGVECLKEKLTNLVLQAAEDDDLATSGKFRLPIDRAFTMRGFGCVITGSLISGKVKVGDEIELLPTMEKVRVRGIQVHGREVEEAGAGQRAALNLAGVKTVDVRRGYTLAALGYLKPTMMIDCTLHHLTSAKRALVNRARVRFHVGTSEVMARVVILDKETIPPGDTALVQFRLESPVVVERGDRYVIRSYSPMRTIGGGTVLRPYTKKIKRFDQTQLDTLELMKKGDPREIVEQALIEAGLSLASVDDLCKSVNMPKSETQEIIASLTSEGRLRAISTDSQISVDPTSTDAQNNSTLARSIVLAHTAVIERAKNEILETLRQYHRVNPLKLGMDELALKSAHRDSIPFALIPTLISELLNEKKLKLTNRKYALADFELELSPEQTEIRKSVENAFLNNKFSPPSIDEVVSQLSGGKSRPQDMSKLRSVAETLLEDGTLIEVSGVYFHKRAIREMQDKIVKHINAKGSVKVSEVRDLLGTTRKYTLPVLEYLDKIGITKRVGDERVLSGGGS